jgi:hypothetical protein
LDCVPDLRKRPYSTPLRIPPERCPLSSHVLLIAAIFVPYLTFMIGLGAYIYRSGQPRNEIHHEQSPDDGEGPDRDEGPVLLRAAA